MEYHVVDQILECSSISAGGSNVEYSLEEDLVLVVDFVILEKNYSYDKFTNMAKTHSVNDFTGPLVGEEMRKKGT